MYILLLTKQSYLPSCQSHFFCNLVFIFEGERLKKMLTCLALKRSARGGQNVALRSMCLTTGPNELQDLMNIFCFIIEIEFIIYAAILYHLERL